MFVQILLIHSFFIVVVFTYLANCYANQINLSKLKSYSFVLFYNLQNGNIEKLQKNK